MIKTGFFKLKHITEIMIKNPNFKFDNNNAFRGKSCDGNSWFINEEMASKFGNGQTYEFKFLNNSDDYSNKQYTHFCLDDNFYYHEDWFELADSNNIKMDPTIFGIEDLEIPEV